MRGPQPGKSSDLSRKLHLARRIYWPAVTVDAMQADNLPRVLGAMGFDRYCGSVPRGEITWWRPAYVAIRSGIFDGYGQRSASYLLPRRNDAAVLNRAMRDSLVHLLALGERVICVDEWCGEGEWRSADGANRGRDLIELGMWLWGCEFGQAAGRIASLIGMKIIPTVAQ